MCFLTARIVVGLHAFACVCCMEVFVADLQGSNCVCAIVFRDNCALMDGAVLD